MKPSKFIGISAVLGIVGLLTIALGACTEKAGGGAEQDAAVSAQKKVRWQMQSAFGSKLPHLGPSATRFVDDVFVRQSSTI